MKKTGALAILLIVLFSRNCFAQFQLNNDAAAMGGDVYMLTPDDYNKAGSMWYKLQHDLTLPFNLQGRLFLGADDGGADGIAFVFQNNCLNAGTAGGGIGYGGMGGKSFAIEFDTYENTTPATGSFNNSDPTYDHIAVMRNGNVDHGDATNNLFGPVRANALLDNIEDNAWHDVQISYNPTTQNLLVYLDNDLRVNFTYDIINNVFDGNQFVYWGFTSATGGSKNYQATYINPKLTTFVLRDTIICPGQTVHVELPELTRFYGKNVALGKPTIASSSGFPSAEAVDGNSNTRWESFHNIDPSWLYVDLGSPYDLDSVIIHWEVALASQYEIQVSEDALSWTTVYTETDVNRLNGYPPTNLKDTIIASASNIRYVRMYGTARATPYGYSMWEFQVYAKPKYVWSPNDGSIDDIYSATPTFSPVVTTNYSVIAPDPCGAVTYNMKITVDCALPVELLYFNAQRVSNKGHLTWSTSMELNSSHFIVMKSTDGFNFFPIGRVNAAGNSQTQKNYFFDDPQLPLNGTVYYRLSTVDIDGSSENSIIRQLTVTDEDIYLVNPVFEDETTLIVSGEPSWVKLTVVDALGRIVLDQYHAQLDGPLTFGSTLAPTAGFYIAIVQTATANKSFKMVKRK